MRQCCVKLANGRRTLLGRFAKLFNGIGDLLSTSALSFHALVDGFKAGRLLLDLGNDLGQQAAYGVGLLHTLTDILGKFCDALHAGRYGCDHLVHNFLNIQCCEGGLIG